MKVLHAAQTLPGGIASYLDEIIPFQVATFGTSMVRVLAPASQLHHLERVPDGVMLPAECVGRSPGALLRFLLALREALACEKPDVLHLHSTFAGALGRLPYLFGGARPRIVYCAHGWAFCMDGAPAMCRTYAVIERVLARVTDQIHNISAAEQVAAHAAGIAGDRQRLVLSGIRREAPVATVAPDGPVRLLFIGRHDRQKGLDVLLDAMERVDGVELDVVGDSVQSHFAAGDRPHVTFHGWQRRDQLGRFLARCHAVVMPSRWEGFGLVAVEAMRAGRAVVASDAGALPEIIQDGVTGRIVPIGDVRALARAIATLDPAMLRRMGQAARARFLERFTADRMNDAIVADYAPVRVAAPVPVLAPIGAVR